MNALTYNDLLTIWLLGGSAVGLIFTLISWRLEHGTGSFESLKEMM